MYAHHYEPRLVHLLLLSHFLMPFPSFEGGFFQKIISLCMVSTQEQFAIKSSL